MVGGEFPVALSLYAGTRTEVVGSDAGAAVHSPYGGSGGDVGRRGWDGEDIEY